MVMQRLTRPPDYQQYSEFGHHEEVNPPPPADLAWPDLSLTIPPSGQDLFFTQSHLYNNGLAHRGQPGEQPQPQTQNLDDLSIFPLDTDSHYWPDFPNPHWLSDPQTFSSAQASSVSSMPIPRSHRIPLTPPDSAKDEGISPVWETADSHNYATSCALTEWTPSGDDHSRGQSTASRNFPTISPPPEPVETISNGDFASLFNLDPLFPNLDVLEQNYDLESLPNSDRQSLDVALQTVVRQSSHVDQQTLPSSYNFSLRDSMHDSNALDFMNNTMNEYMSGNSAQPLQPEAPPLPVSFFDSLEPESDRGRVGEGTGKRPPQIPTDKDRLLIEWKNKGLSYKEIRSRGRFEEAESTLRGRYRTLTKPKHLRVRKPEWKPRDVAVLLEAVDCHLKPNTETQSLRDKKASEMRRRAEKLPWKQVAEFMEKRGCYRYGNSTVKKKYLQLMDESIKP